MYKGIGPRGLGSPLKQTSKSVKGGMLKEATATAKLPSEKPSLSDAVKYAVATKTTARTWESKQHPSMVHHKVETVKGTPPMVGSTKMFGLASKGFKLMKSATSAPKVAKAAEVVGEGLEVYNTVKGKK